jgi:hypothetical protein
LKQTSKSTSKPNRKPGLPSGTISRRRFVSTAAGSMAALMGIPESVQAAEAPVQKQFRIHPAIGVARVGNADPNNYFVGPEAPDFGPVNEPAGWQHKVNGLTRPQAARFRIFEYDMDANGVWQPAGEVNLSSPNVVAINWSVHLANQKASFHQFGGLAGETTPPLGLRNASVTDRSTLETDFGARSISGASAPPAIFQPTGQAGETYPRKPDGSAVINYLGQLRTDSSGRLIVIGGKGVAGYNTSAQPPLQTYANNDNWFDDVSDGPVTATITLQTAPGVYTKFDALGAWALVTPPDFAPQISNMVSLYDLLLDMAVRELPVPENNGLYASRGPLARIAQLQQSYTPGAGPELPGVAPDFDSEIKPILLSGYNYYFVDDLVPTRHAILMDPNNGNPSPAYNTQRQFITGFLRPPAGVTGYPGKQSMPALLGDDAYGGTGNTSPSSKYMALTHTQYGLLYNWATGPFIASGSSPAPIPTITPWGLDRAALENCAGGGFFPGIEAGWQIRASELYLEPFRINLNATSQYYGETGSAIGPGHFSRQLAVPWHADFNDCRNENNDGWWPGQRPNSVYVPATQNRIDWARPDTTYQGGGQKSSHLDMVNNWYKFGFVVLNGSVFVETERDSGIQ